MTRPIGETFRITEYHPGLPETITILEVVESKNGECTGCYLDGFCMSQHRFKAITGLCSPMLRKDRKSVLFKKVKTLG